MALWDTLEASFPAGLLSSGLEHTIKGKVRKRLRDIGYRLTFPPGESWEQMIEVFGIAALDKIHRGFGDNPWFWVVGWPAVIGAAAAEFFPDVGTPAARRTVAAEASAGHLEALLLSRAIGNSEAFGALPEPCVRGLRASGQTAMPALPHVQIDRQLAAAPNGGMIADRASDLVRNGPFALADMDSRTRLLAGYVDQSAPLGLPPHVRQAAESNTSASSDWSLPARPGRGGPVPSPASPAPPHDFVEPGSMQAPYYTAGPSPPMPAHGVSGLDTPPPPSGPPLMQMAPGHYQ